MLDIKKYGAIDIGSNAIRLLISTVTEVAGRPPVFKKTSLVRVPIRLGTDVFVHNRISEPNIARMLDSMKAYQLLMATHQVNAYKACATSAMREAENGQAVAEKILQETGISIEIIDGDSEAAIIAATDLHDLIDSEKSYLYVDVGGGSTEFTIYSHGTTVASRSFKIGTVRLLNDLVAPETWTELEHWIKEHTKTLNGVDLIGSGGNINNIFKSSGKAMGKPLSYFYLSSYYQLLTSLTYEERIVQLNLNQDRADVIVPAARIYLSAMKWSKARKVHVPKIGLSDGIIKTLYNQDKSASISV